MDPLFLILAIVLIASLLWRLLPREQAEEESDEMDFQVPAPVMAPSADTASELQIVDEGEFAEHVKAALEGLPEEFATRMENIEVLVEPWPRVQHRRSVGLKPWQTLYGLYQGVPLTRRQHSYGLVTPDVITIFSEPLRRDFPSPERLRKQIRRTVLHEIAHHFGISDERLHELDAY